SSSKKTVKRELRRMLAAGAIASEDERRYEDSYDGARTTLRHLHGTRRAELGAVLSNLDEIAADGLLTVSRLPSLFLTLERNRQWWSTGPLLSYGRRIEFPHSRLIWQ